MILACVNVYNEERMLPGCLDSIADQVDRIVVVDGRYAQFPGQGAVSTDSTVAIAEAFGAEVIGPPGGQPWPSQMAKRSAYLVGDEGDWYLRIDADERLVGDLPAELQDGVSYALRVRWLDEPTQSWLPCLFQHRGLMRYRGAHCALWSDDRLISRVCEAARLRRPYLLHLTKFRETERMRAKRQYYAWQRQAELEYRQQWQV